MDYDPITGEKIIKCSEKNDAIVRDRRRATWIREKNKTEGIQIVQDDRWTEEET